MLNLNLKELTALFIARTMFAALSKYIISIEMIDETVYKALSQNPNVQDTIRGDEDGVEIIVRETDNYDFYEVRTTTEQGESISQFFRIKTLYHNTEQQETLTILHYN